MRREDRPSPGGVGWLAPIVSLAAGVLLVTVSASALVLAEPVQSLSPRLTFELPTEPHATMPLTNGVDDAKLAFEEFGQALSAGNYPAADSYMSDRLRASGVSTRTGFNARTGVSAEVISAETEANGITLTVHLSYQEAGLPVESENTVPMVLENGSWKIDDVFWL